MGGGGNEDDERLTAFGLLLEAHAAVTAAVSADLEQDAGLPLTSFEVLVRLARSPDQRLRMSDLASQVALSTSGLTRLIDRMEDEGLVRRDTCPTDRRGAYAVLTPKGRRSYERARPAHLDSIERHLIAPLGPSRAAQLDAMLRTLRDARNVFAQ